MIAKSDVSRSKIPPKKYLESLVRLNKSMIVALDRKLPLFATHIPFPPAPPTVLFTSCPMYLSCRAAKPLTRSVLELLQHVHSREKEREKSSRRRMVEGVYVVSSVRGFSSNAKWVWFWFWFWFMGWKVKVEGEGEGEFAIVTVEKNGHVRDLLLLLYRNGIEVGLVLVFCCSK